MVSRRTVLGLLTSAAVIATTGVASAKQGHHKNGQALIGGKLKQNGNHMIDKVGEHRVSANVVNQKIASVNVKHSKKGDVPVKKYKTPKKLAYTPGFRVVAFTLAQLQDLGTTYIGYAFVDDVGDEWIYWFPYEMILDGDTGAVEYVALS